MKLVLAGFVNFKEHIKIVYHHGLLGEVGGLTFGANVERMMLGDVEEVWDKVAIAMYPSRGAMLEMMQMPKMQEIGLHRAAGLAGQLNIETSGAVGELIGSS